MDKILDLRKEHIEIERLLFLIEKILNKEKLNLKGIKDVFNKLFFILEMHEEKEDFLFPELCKFSKEMENSLDEINMIHKTIKGHVKVIRKALDSGNENYIRLSIENDGRMFFSKLREHMHSEEMIFDSILFLKNVNYLSPNYFNSKNL